MKTKEIENIIGKYRSLYENKNYIRTRLETNYDRIRKLSQREDDQEKLLIDNFLNEKIDYLTFEYNTIINGVFENVVYFYFKNDENRKTKLIIHVDNFLNEISNDNLSVVSEQLKELDNVSNEILKYENEILEIYYKNKTIYDKLKSKIEITEYVNEKKNIEEKMISIRKIFKDDILEIEKLNIDSNYKNKQINNVLYGRFDEFLSSRKKMKKDYESKRFKI